eukprot:1182765-Prorocentrum_minimum.AAC.8
MHNFWCGPINPPSAWGKQGCGTRSIGQPKRSKARKKATNFVRRALLVGRRLSTVCQSNAAAGLARCMRDARTVLHALSQTTTMVLTTSAQQGRIQYALLIGHFVQSYNLTPSLNTSPAMQDGSAGLLAPATSHLTINNNPPRNDACRPAAEPRLHTSRSLVAGRLCL